MKLIGLVLLFSLFILPPPTYTWTTVGIFSCKYNYTLRHSRCTLISQNLYFASQRVVDPDEDGWIYTDHKWENERKESDAQEPISSSLSVHSQKENRSRYLTRRRRWYRKAEKIHKTY